MHNVSDVLKFSTCNTSYIQQTLYILCTCIPYKEHYILYMIGIHILLGTTSTCMCVCTGACGMGSMRQQLHLDHDEIMELNIFTNIDNEQFLFRKCM